MFAIKAIKVQKQMRERIAIFPNGKKVLNVYKTYYLGPAENGTKAKASFMEILSGRNLSGLNT